MNKIEIASEVRYAIVTVVNDTPMFLTLDPVKKNDYYLTSDIRKASKTLDKPSADAFLLSYQLTHSNDNSAYEIVPYDVTYSYIDDEV